MTVEDLQENEIWDLDIGPRDAEPDDWQGILERVSRDVPFWTWSVWFGVEAVS